MLVLCVMLTASFVGVVHVCLWCWLCVFWWCYVLCAMLTASFVGVVHVCVWCWLCMFCWCVHLKTASTAHLIHTYNHHTLNFPIFYWNGEYNNLKYPDISRIYQFILISSVSRCLYCIQIYDTEIMKIFFGKCFFMNRGIKITNV